MSTSSPKRILILGGGFAGLYAAMGPDPEEVSQRNELAERVRRFTILISPTLRKTFQLRHVHGLSIRDTATVLGVPSGTVKARTARARAKLKLLMQNSVGRKREGI